jgi:hypothetical protein
MEILRKITIKTAGGFSIARIKEVMEAAKLAEGASVDLLKIVGISTSAKTGQTDKGQFTKLMGEFAATDLTTGAMFQSQQCILPEFVGGVLGAALAGNSSGVEFAFKIGARRKDTSVTGYEFVVLPLMESKSTDRMQALLALAGIDPTAKPAALAAPTPAVDPAPTPAADPTPAPAADPAPADKGGKGGKGGKT